MRSEVKLMVALIGNGNVYRDELVLETLGVIRNSVPTNWEVVHRTISWQPTDHPLAIRVRLARIFAVARSVYRWELYRRISHRFSKMRGLPNAVLALTAYLFSQVFNWGKEGQSGFRHIQLTRKHILAWESFLNSDSDYLVCLEDDAFPLADCKTKLKTMFDRLNGTNEDLYVLLSRGVNQELLRFSARESKHLNETLFEPPVAYTNTTAGYLISKGMAEKFLAEVQNLPAGPLVNIDFLINFLFSRLNSCKGEPALMCWHFSEPPLDNASISSDLGSTISYIKET